MLNKNIQIFFPSLSFSPTSLALIKLQHSLHTQNIPCTVNYALFLNVERRVNGSLRKYTEYKM